MKLLRNNYLQPNKQKPPSSLNLMKKDGLVNVASNQQKRNYGGIVKKLDFPAGRWICLPLLLSSRIWISPGSLSWVPLKRQRNARNKRRIALQVMQNNFSSKKPPLYDQKYQQLVAFASLIIFMPTKVFAYQLDIV